MNEGYVEEGKEVREWSAMSAGAGKRRKLKAKNRCPDHEQGTVPEVTKMYQPPPV